MIYHTKQELAEYYDVDDYELCVICERARCACRECECCGQKTLLAQTEYQGIETWACDTCRGVQDD